MNKTSGSIVACAVAMLFALPFASADTPQAPKPTAEHKRLGYFVGEWKTEGEMRPGDMGPGGKVTATDKCEWFEGGFSVICHSKGTSPMGPTKSVGILGYSSEDKVYTYYAVDNSNMTMSTVPHGMRQGDTWNYTDESMVGGKKVKTRVTIKELSPTEYTFAMEMEGANGKWDRVMESKSTKVK
jgi:hypothetical protein